MYDRRAKHFRRHRFNDAQLCATFVRDLYNHTRDKCTQYVQNKKNWYKFVAERPDDDMYEYIPTGVGKFFGYLKLYKPNNHFNENNVFEFRTNYTRI